ncbi:BlaI/MecI/CopY family transcriptional regulator [Streptomyces sp. NPDC101110]|uniref:BlaI/MecI/CopY family transcriptional regulator n=1 Tax=unclassified Streptomyces TaxID=2593676 RepID=UPI0038071AF7
MHDDTTDLKPLYAARLAEDLERNVQEQERVAREVAQMHERLEALRHNHALLVSMQQALGDMEMTATGSSPGAQAPVPHQASGQPAAPAGKSPTATRTSSATGSGKSVGGAVPTLRDLVVRHLQEAGEPRSALDVTAALTQQHPDRHLKITVVRSTLEAMVAKGHVRRNKQGKSVFYSADVHANTRNRTAPV